MVDARIITNHHSRPLKTFYDLPEDERRWFDYIMGEDRYSLRMFQYKGEWYDVDEFMVIIPKYCELHSKFREWDAYQSDSFFSGVLIKYPYDKYSGYDYENIIVGLYLS